jgi:FLYWCH zinc finger domain
LLVHDGYCFGIQYIRKDKKYWQCNLSRKFNCKARVTTTDAGDIIVTNNEHCHTEIRQHLRKEYKQSKLQAQLNSQLSNHHMSFVAGGDLKLNLPYMGPTTSMAACVTGPTSIPTTQTSIMSRQITTTNSFAKNLSISRSRSPSVTPPPLNISPKCSPHE